MYKFIPLDVRYEQFYAHLLKSVQTGVDRRRGPLANVSIREMMLGNTDSVGHLIESSQEPVESTQQSAGATLNKISGLLIFTVIALI